jgi:signal transduction histidine kinase
MKDIEKDSTHELKRKLSACQKSYNLLLKSSAQEQAKSKRFTKQILQQQEEEKKEISRELHDEIAQLLTGVNFHLSVLSIEAYGAEKSLHNKIKKAQHLIIDSVNAIYLFTKELRPVILDDLGLIPALRSHVKDFIKHTKIPVVLDLPRATLDINEFSQIIIFRIIQESLNNIRKHAEATQVEVSLKKNSKSLHLMVKNNGKSFYIDRKKCPGMGLTGITERVKLLNGTLAITSTPKAGTKIKISMPLPEGPNF